MYEFYDIAAIEGTETIPVFSTPERSHVREENEGGFNFKKLSTFVPDEDNYDL